MTHRPATLATGAAFGAFGVLYGVWAVLLTDLAVGLRLSAVAPLAFSLAGRARPDRAGRASSVITTIGYAGFLFGPGTIGTVAELSSLRIGLAVVVVAGLLVAALSSAPSGEGTALARTDASRYHPRSRTTPSNAVRPCPDAATRT